MENWYSELGASLLLLLEKKELMKKDTYFSTRTALIKEMAHFLKQKFDELARQNLRPQPEANASTLLANNDDLKEIGFMLLSHTGAGKTCLLNLIYNWSQGIEDIRDIRDTLVETPYLKGKHNDTGQDMSSKFDSSQSQTKEAKKYSFKVNYQNVAYKLSIIDTPGFMDTNGEEEDQKNLELILQSLRESTNLNGIIMILNGTQPRMDARMMIVTHKIKNLFGDKLKNNMLLVLSNTQMAPNLNVRSLGFDLPNDQIFKLNNLLYTIDLRSLNATETETLQENYQFLKRMLNRLFQAMDSMGRIELVKISNQIGTKSELAWCIENLMAIFEAHEANQLQIKANEGAMAQAESDYIFLLNEQKKTKKESASELRKTDVQNLICRDCGKSCEAACNCTGTYCQIIRNGHCLICAHRAESHHRAYFCYYLVEKIVPSVDPYRLAEAGKKKERLQRDREKLQENNSGITQRLHQCAMELQRHPLQTILKEVQNEINERKSSISFLSIQSWLIDNLK